MSSDRAAVAREVLTEIAEHLRSYGDSNAPLQSVVQQYRDEHYPAPAAPVTVTVRRSGGSDTTLYLRENDGWYRPDGAWFASAESEVGSFLFRIASDERRIEELEAANASLKAEIDRISAMRQDALGELVRVGHERDEARRALDDLKSRAALGDRDARAALAAQVQAATSQGEGHEVGVSAATCGGSGAAQPVSSNTGELSAAAPSPAPIPHGAVVEVSGITYQRTEVGDWSSAHRWISRNSHEANTLDALYRALHPVADAATVKRVAQAIFRDRWRGDKGMRDGVRDTYCNDARAALRELGYTIQEGEA